MTLPAPREDILDQVDQVVAPGNSYTGSWVSTAGVAKVAVRWSSSGGLTGISATIEESVDASNVVGSQAVANGDVSLFPLGASFVRLKLDNNSGANTTFRATLRAVG